MPICFTHKAHKAVPGELRFIFDDAFVVRHRFHRSDFCYDRIRWVSPSLHASNTVNQFASELLLLMAPNFADSHWSIGFIVIQTKWNVHQHIRSDATEKYLHWAMLCENTGLPILYWIWFNTNINATIIWWLHAFECARLMMLRCGICKETRERDKWKKKKKQINRNFDGEIPRQFIFLVRDS